MTIDNFEDAVAECHSKGFTVRNCFERSAGGWQANLGAVGAKVYSEFGISTTPHGAIMEALKGAPDLTPVAAGGLFD